VSHFAPPPILSALDFLIGRFRGEGTFENGATTFDKQVVGRWEVGGHFLSLSMTAAYRFEDAIADVHRAMALVGVDSASGELEAHVFTDGGRVHQHRLRVEHDRVWFGDRVPHETRARQARKILRPTPYGYDETLEVDRSGERFEPYSFVRLRRTSG
jgi:hypothetical protein